MQISSLALSLLGLVVVLALVLLAGRVARGIGLPGRLHPTHGRLATLQVLPLDARRRLHLMRCDQRNFLLLTGGAEDLMIGWLDPPAATAAEPPP